MIKTQISNLKFTFYPWTQSALKECQLFTWEKDSVPVWKKRSWQWYSSLTATKLPTELDSCEDDSSPKLTTQQENSPIIWSDQSLNGWIAHTKERFCSFPGVESIYLAIQENNIDIWLLIPQRDFELVGRLVDIEMKILDDFGTKLFPEFHIIYRCGRNESQLVPREAIRLTC